MSEVAAAILRQFLLFTAILAPLELLVPARGQQRPWRRRGLVTDLFHFVLNPLLVAALAGAILTALAGIPTLLPAAAEQPYWLQFVEVLLLSELAGYWVHRLSHQIPWLWRFHAVHHTAEELDWVAAHRQHPLEST
jgi:sterol desaturase/sphingolipid hydroxylase (fatty acid hydroxylase superfamily)